VSIAAERGAERRRPAGGKSITAIVVSYRTRDLVLPLLGDLVAQLEPFAGSRVVVLDNASGDGTAEAIAERFPAVQVEASPTNLGFAVAVNRAAKGADGRWLLLVNPDLRLDDGAVAALVEAAEAQPGHGMYGGRFVDIGRQTAEDSVAVLPSLAQLASYASGAATVARRLGWQSPPRRAASGKTTTVVDALPGTFLLIERDAWDELGGFDERYFMYGEDLDLSLRMTASGRHPLFVPAASVRHAGGASSSSAAKEVLKLTSLITLLRARWTPREARLGELLLLAGVGVRRLARLPVRTPDGRFETAWRQRRLWRRGW
jgi:GT2 family glycosyltransferase